MVRLRDKDVTLHFTLWRFICEEGRVSVVGELAILGLNSHVSCLIMLLPSGARD